MKTILYFFFIPVLLALTEQSNAQPKITADKIGDKIEIRIMEIYLQITSCQNMKSTLFSTR